MAEWGGIARAVEEGLIDAADAGDTSGGSLQGLAEALTGSNFAGFRIGDIFDEDRWSRREREHQGKRLEETGIPDYTYDYVPTDRGVTTGLGPSDLTDEEMRDSRLGPHGGRDSQGSSAFAGRPRELDNIRQWGTQNPNVSGSMALDPTWAGGVRGAGLGAEVTPGEGRDLSGLSRDSKFAPGTVPGNITGTRGYLPGKMSVGEARRARAMRNMTDEEQRNLSQLDRDRVMDHMRQDEAVFEDENYLERMRAIVEARSNKRQGGQFLRNIHDSSGPTPPRTHPDWGAIEEDMSIRANRNRFEREYEGRDY